MVESEKCGVRWDEGRSGKMRGSKQEGGISTKPETETTRKGKRSIGREERKARQQHRGMDVPRNR